MRPFYYTVALLLFLSSLAVAGPPPPRGAHVLSGPFAFDESGKPLPEYYYLDGKRVHTVERLKAAVLQLPPEFLIVQALLSEPPNEIRLACWHMSNAPNTSNHAMERTA